MSVMLSRYRCQRVLDCLEEAFPDARCELDHRNPYELLIATILSAQCTDVRVNAVTKTLFAKYPTPQALAASDLFVLEEDIREVGLYRSKAHNIRATAQQLVEQYDGQVPSTMEALVSLPGVGRKTANVVLSTAFGVPAIAVDTHVFRVANRIGLSKSEEVHQCEKDLQAAIPKKRWTRAHHLLIFQGRRICRARNPRCEECCVRRDCLFFRERPMSTFPSRKSL